MSSALEEIRRRPYSECGKYDGRTLRALAARGLIVITSEDQVAAPAPRMRPRSAPMVQLPLPLE
jgi:hypothetical protein